MKTTNIFLIILFLIFSFSSCKKDKIVSKNISHKNECLDFEDTEGPSHHVIYHDALQFKNPHFNPNNPNEFVYYYIDYESNKHQLIKYNLLSKEKTVLTNGFRIVGQAIWSKQNWVAFGSLDYHIWKVKGDGNGLTRLTNKGVNISPFWDVSGENLYWRSSKFLATQPIYNVVLNSEEEIDTLGNVTIHLVDVNENNWILNGRGIGGERVKYGYFNMNTSTPFDNFIELFDTQNNNTENGTKAGLCWGNNNRTFYYTNFKGKNNDQSGLFVVYGENKFEKIMDFCKSKRYGTISCSPDGKHLIGERVDVYIEKETGRHFENSTIWLIDLNTLEETKVEL